MPQAAAKRESECVLVVEIRRPGKHKVWREIKRGSLKDALCALRQIHDEEEPSGTTVTLYGARVTTKEYYDSQTLMVIYQANADDVEPPAA